MYGTDARYKVRNAYLNVQRENATSALTRPIELPSLLRSPWPPRAPQSQHMPQRTSLLQVHAQGLDAGSAQLLRDEADILAFSDSDEELFPVREFPVSEEEERLRSALEEEGCRLRSCARLSVRFFAASGAVSQQAK